MPTRLMFPNTLPRRLVRAYEKREDADSFASAGRLRLGALRWYRTIDNAPRRDASEGRGRLRVPGEVPRVLIERGSLRTMDAGTVPGEFDYGTTSIHPTYVLCCTDASAGYPVEAEKFGSHRVEIFNPQAFVDEFFGAACRVEIGDRRVMTVDCLAVRYDKDAVAARPEGIDEQYRLIYGQKPASHAAEQEFRLAVVVSGGPNGAPEYVYVQLAGVENFARLMGELCSSAV